MRLKTLLLVAIVAALLPIVGILRTEQPAEASALLQEAPRLDGANIYFTESAKEPSRFDRLDTGLSHFAGLLRLLGANLYTLEWRTGFPTDADLIVIAGPIDDLAPDQIARLWSYVNNKGRLLLLTDPVVAPVKALPANSGLFSLMWADMGIRARADVAVTEGTSQGEATQQVLVTDFLTDHLSDGNPITSGLSGDLAFFGARSIEYDASPNGFTVTPLVFTASDFYGETAYDQYLKDGVIQFNIGRDTSRSSLALAVAYDNEKTASRIVVIGDRDFAINGKGFSTSPPNSASFLYPNNVRFMLNAAAWLLERQSTEMNFPTPGPTATVTLTPTITPTPAPTLTPTPGS